MTAAERLKAEIASEAPITKGEFISEISKRIKRNGRAMYICDRHITETNIYSRDCVQMKYENLVKEYAVSEGFNVSYRHNSYGVRYIVFTL